MKITHWRHPGVDLNAPKKRNKKGQFAKRINFVWFANREIPVVIYTLTFVCLWSFGYLANAFSVQKAFAENRPTSVLDACYKVQDKTLTLNQVVSSEHAEEFKKECKKLGVTL